MNVSRHNMTVGSRTRLRRFSLKDQIPAAMFNFFPYSDTGLDPGHHGGRNLFFVYIQTLGKSKAILQYWGTALASLHLVGPDCKGVEPLKTMQYFFLQADCWTSEVQLASLFVDNCIFPRCITKLQHTGWGVGIECHSTLGLLYFCSTYSAIKGSDGQCRQVLFLPICATFCQFFCPTFPTSLRSIFTRLAMKCTKRISK